MKKLLLWMSLFLFISWAAQATSINIDNESFSVELVAQPICGTLQESIFHLQRENYTTESQAIAFNYTTTCNDKAIIVNKEIKKYTESKTGSCNFVKSGNYSITFTYLNKTEEWVLPVICEQEEKENISAQPICFEEFSLNLNKRVFEKGEQLLMDFSINPIPDSLEITYWIETLNGSSIKGKRTTTNIDTKKHTFQTIQVPEQGAFVHAIANDNCSKQEREELILLKGTAEEKVDEQTEPSLDIIKVEQQEDLLEAEILAYRGNSKSSVITIDLKNQQGKIISSEKIKLEKK
ncbi:MAG: hypothetical protein KDK61_09150, partial [Simkania sp.]|nr:hypothetical protein [Simkania sp.]